MSNRIYIMAGGTAGHIFPGIAIAKELKNRGKSIHWIATKNGMENEILKKYDYKVHRLHSCAIRGKGIINFFKALFILFISFFKIMLIFIRKRPNKVIGMGGYASAIGAIAAKILFIDLSIHEQNKIPGTTNKILSKLNINIFQAFADSFNKKTNAITVGNPLLLNFKAKKPPKSIKKILIIGGSLGAKKINEVIAKMQINADIWHQTGKNNFQYTNNLYKNKQNKYNNIIKLEAFINDMDKAYQWADLVICRAGAMSVSEIIASKSISILIPYPYAVDNHQLYNAKHITDINAGILLKDEDLSVVKIVNIINSFNKENLNVMHKSLLTLKQNNSAKKIVDYLLIPKRSKSS